MRAVSDRTADILEAACRVIAREGADGLRMGQVAREAGVSSALIHYYFATRADLLLRAFEHADEQADLTIDALIGDLPDGRGQAGARAGRLRGGHALPQRLDPVGRDVARRDLRRAPAARRPLVQRPVGRGDRRPDPRGPQRRVDRPGRRRGGRGRDPADRAGRRPRPPGADRDHGSRPGRRSSSAARSRPSSMSHPRRRRLHERHAFPGLHTSGDRLHVARDLRAGDARGLHAGVELRLPRQRRRRARALLDDVDRGRAGRRHPRRRRHAARAVQRLPPPGVADRARRGHLPEGAALPLPRLDVPQGRPAGRGARGARRSPTSTARRCACPASGWASCAGWCSSA